MVVVRPWCRRDSSCSRCGACQTQRPSMGSVAKFLLDDGINKTCCDTRVRFLVRLRGRLSTTPAPKVRRRAADEDGEVLKKVQKRFEVNIGEIPRQIDATSYLIASAQSLGPLTLTCRKLSLTGCPSVSHSHPCQGAGRSTQVIPDFER